MGCIKCKYAPKCPDAFTEKSHLCGNYEKDEEIIPEAATNEINLDKKNCIPSEYDYLEDMELTNPQMHR